MIKDLDKKKKKAEKSLPETLIEYARTVFISFCVALIITIGLTIQARKSMIKDLYDKAVDDKKLDEQIAKQIIAQSDLTKNLLTKNYTICMNVGNLYETAKDYQNAQIAYQAAVLRAKRGVYAPYYKLTSVLIAQSKFDEAEDVINSVTDLKNKGLIKYKTRAYIETGDKYYSLGKFLKAARSYERAKYYYDRFTKKDKVIDESIKKRIVNAYSEAATVVVQQGYNSDAAGFLKKAEKYAPNDFHIKYKLAVIYSDLDPIQSVEYFEPLLKKVPQYIDYNTYVKALIKAANISELEGNITKAKYYRYKNHSIDLMISNKVIYKNDIDILMESFEIKKFLFRYHLKGKYKFKNNSSNDILRMFAEFELRESDKVKEVAVVQCVSKDHPLFSNGGESESITINFGKNIFTKKELSNYVIDVYLYKDEKFKTLIGTFAIPAKSIKNAVNIDTPEFY